MIRSLWALGVRTTLMLAVGLVTAAFALLGLQYPALGGFVLAVASLKRLRRGWRLTDNYGSARFAQLDDLQRNGLLGHRGLILGKLRYVERPRRSWAVRLLFNPLVKSELACRQCFIAFLGSRWIGDVFIRVQSFTHLLTVAPAGGGKTINTLAPNLLSYPGNCVVIDPKGELYNISAKHRRKKFGHKIVRLDPALLCGPGANRFNPFDFVDANAKAFLGVCRDMANMMVTRTGREDDPHWNESAESVICAFIAYICACEGDREARTLSSMRQFLASRENFELAKEQMKQMEEEFYGVLCQLGRSLDWHVERELGSVMSNVQRHSRIYDDPMISESTRDTDWNPSELRTGRMTVYLIVPADRLEVWAGLQRLWLGTLLRLVTRGVPTEKNPVLFLVDECAHIGKMQALENAITLLRGAGVRVWLFFQSLDQLHKCFGEHASIVQDNLSTQQYFSINSYATAEILSNRIGDQTIVITSEGDNEGSTQPNGPTLQNQRSRNRGTSRTVSEHSRKLLRPEEILLLDDSVSLVFHRNLPVIPAGRIKHFADRAFRWGGVGKSRGLGVGGAVAALAALAFSAACLAVALLAPVPTPGPGRDSGAVPRPQPSFPTVRRYGQPMPSVPPPFSRPDYRPITPPGLRRGPSPPWELNRGKANGAGQSYRPGWR